MFRSYRAPPRRVFNILKFERGNVTNCTETSPTSTYHALPSGMLHYEMKNTVSELQCKRLHNSCCQMLNTTRIATISL